MIHTILFDLDDTLYPRHSGIMEQIRRLILSYMRFRLQLSAQEADVLRKEYLQAYGTTMRGLQIHHAIDTEDFLTYVHDIPILEYIQPNAELDTVLASISQDKVIFTNASSEHAERVLATLGVRHHFSRIVDIRDMAFRSKPHADAYQRICDLLQIRPQECILVEDSLRNLYPAKDLGMTTVLVTSEVLDGHNGVDFVIRRAEDIHTVLAQLPAPSKP